jgi:integrase
MPKIKLTKSFCDGTQAPAVNGVLPPGEYSDTELRGLQLRVLPSGTRQFVIRYRVGGAKKRHVLGDYGQLTVAEARTHAKKLLGQIATGADPSNAKAEARKAWTVRRLVEHYRQEVLPKLSASSQEGYERYLKKSILPLLGSKDAAKVAPSDVLQMFRAAERAARTVDENGAVKNAGTTTANRVLATASALFSEAIAQGIRTDNPCSAVKRNAENKRERFLSDLETAKLLSACDRSPHQLTANLLRLLVYTGARKGETMRARWEQFDLIDGVWTKPSHQTKQKRLHAIPLMPAAVEMLREMHAENLAGANSPWVFPGRKPNEAVASPKRSISAILKDAGLSGDDMPQVRRVSPHVLRHSFATQLLSKGANITLVGKALGHTQASTTNRYAHAEQNPLRQIGSLMDTSIREAKERLREEEAASALAATGDNVVAIPFRKAG